MTTVTMNYAASAAITCTLTSLGVDGWRESASVDNTTNKYVDALVGGSIQVGAITADGTIEVYAYASFDGTDYSGGLAGTDETITWGTTPASSSVEGYNNLFLLGVASVDTTDDNNDIEFGPFSLASSIGQMPSKWGVVIKNATDIAFHATGSANGLDYIGVKYDSA